MFLVLIEHFNSTVTGKHILHDSIFLNSFNAMSPASQPLGGFSGCPLCLEESLLNSAGVYGYRAVVHFLSSFSSRYSTLGIVLSCLLFFFNSAVSCMYFNAPCLYVHLTPSRLRHELTLF